MADNYHESEGREPAIQIAGRFLGVVVFLVGIGMLAMAFMLAFKAFSNPDMLISTAALRKVPPPPPAVVYVPTALKLLLLFVMGYIGSLVAARGAQFFFSAKREARRAISGD